MAVRPEIITLCGIKLQASFPAGTAHANVQVPILKEDVGISEEFIFHIASHQGFVGTSCLQNRSRRGLFFFPSSIVTGHPFIKILPVPIFLRRTAVSIDDSPHD